MRTNGAIQAFCQNFHRIVLRRGGLVVINLVTHQSYIVYMHCVLHFQIQDQGLQQAINQVWVSTVVLNKLLHRILAF